MVDTTIVNAKIDSYLKERVDHILQREQTTASELIRFVWEDIARTGELPAYYTKTNAIDKMQAQAERIRTLHAAIGTSALSEKAVNADARSLFLDSLLERHDKAANSPLDKSQKKE